MCLNSSMFQDKSWILQFRSGFRWFSTVFAIDFFGRFVRQITHHPPSTSGPGALCLVQTRAWAWSRSNPSRACLSPNFWRILERFGQMGQLIYYLKLRCIWILTVHLSEPDGLSQKNIGKIWFLCGSLQVLKFWPIPYLFELGRCRWCLTRPAGRYISVHQASCSRWGWTETRKEKTAGFCYSIPSIDEAPKVKSLFTLA